MKAFPRNIQFYNGTVRGDWIDDGMELRDYFAAKAMQGMLTNQPLRVDVMLNGASLATSSYQIADAMINERNKNAS